MAWLQPLLFLLLCGWMLLLAHLALRASPFCREVAATAPGRFKALDGLRGFLALGVFFHHLALTYVSNTSGGGWTAPEGEFYTLSGQVAVALFFMITGFLFWGKAMRTKGFMKPWPLYRGRLRRLGPAYAFSILLVLAVLLSPLGPEVALQWRELGRVLMFKGIEAGNPINGIYWTLVWEWRFYLLLPLLAWFANGWRGLVVVAGVIAYALLKPKEVIVINFVAGGLCAALLGRYGYVSWAQGRRGMLLAFAALAATFLLFPTAYGWGPTVMLGLFFFLIVQGNALGGLLHRPEAHLLGAISYSIYLLHCIVLYVGVNLLARAGWFIAALDFSTWIGESLVFGVAVFALALASYRWLEHPFLRRK